MAETEPKKEGSSGGGGGASKLLLALLGVNSLVTVGVLVVVLLRTGAPSTPPAPSGGEATAKAEVGHGDAKGEKGAAIPAADKNLPGPIVKFPDFVVHLRDSEVDRYARITIEVEVQDDRNREALTARLPAIRDNFIAYLSDRTTADLRGSEAIGRAKGEMFERLKASAPGLSLRGLYVTELVVQ